MGEYVLLHSAEVGEMVEFASYPTLGEALEDLIHASQYPNLVLVEKMGDGSLEPVSYKWV